MEIIAATSNGVLISATSAEVKEVLRSVTGKGVDKLEIGQKIPAIDYASTITKVKQLGGNSEFTYLKTCVESFNKYFDRLSSAVISAASLEV